MFALPPGVPHPTPTAICNTENLVTTVSTCSTAQNLVHSVSTRSFDGEISYELLESRQRCEGHFCTKCLDKGDNEYAVLSKSNAMWFCAPCRVHIEKNINNEKMIEQKCKEIMNEFETRITQIESELKNKCDENKVRDIIKEEMATGVNRETQSLSTEAPKTTTNTQEVLSELEDRKKRENNIICFGIEEQTSNEGSERKRKDEKTIRDILSACKLNKELLDSITKVVRLGKIKKPESNAKENEDAKPRPILVSFGSIEDKKLFFKNIRELQTTKEYKSVRISNDLTKTERENEAKLRDDANRMNTEKSQSGKYVFRVRGPPWDRKIVRQIKK
ncbi:uncharacterized protein MCAP_0864-like [Argopecten irradians]|uniref:uncharacterized protein MCAP_0864-like n=1 Tax=Argopecten irradians TaxID=31199 RepID=UPI003711BCCE